MDPNVTITVTQLAELFHEQAEKAKSEDSKVMLADLDTSVRTSIAKNRSPGFNVANWITACGITPDFKRATVAA